MQSLSGVKFNSGEQNKNISMHRDLRDMLNKLAILVERNLVVEDQILRNLMTGLNADSNVNVESAAEVGTKVLKSITGKLVFSSSFSHST